MTLGVGRCSPAACAALLPGTLALLGRTLDVAAEDETSHVAGVGPLLDPSQRRRGDRAYHLVLRCLESAAAAPASAAASAPDGGAPAPLDLGAAKQLLAAAPPLAATLFDLLADVFLHVPGPPGGGGAPPAGLSAAGHRRLVEGGAAEAHGGRNWGEEYHGRGPLRALKLRLLGLLAPCRRHALFLPARRAGGGEDGAAADGAEEGEPDGDAPGTARGEPTVDDGGLGVARTVALMVLLTGDADPDVKAKAEAYLKAHLDAYRGKDVPRQQGAGNGAAHRTTVGSGGDALLGHPVALAHTLLAWGLGGSSALHASNAVRAQYKTDQAATAVRSSLGLTYRIAPAASSPSRQQQQQALLSTCRKPLSPSSSAAVLKFLAQRILDDRPALFSFSAAVEAAADDGQRGEGDAAAVSVGTLVLRVVETANRPGASGSAALEGGARALNSAVVRLAALYDAASSRRSAGAREDAAAERLRALLARSLTVACAVLAPVAAGDAAHGGGGAATRASTAASDVRDQCYGVVCTLARGRFALDARGALFDGGASSAAAPEIASFLPTSIATAELLFGCAAHEVEVLRLRAASALDALLGVYARVVGVAAAAKEERDAAARRQSAEQDGAGAAANPWADIPAAAVAEDASSEPAAAKEDAEAAASAAPAGFSRALLPLLWRASRPARSKSSRLAAARWSSELLLIPSSSNARAEDAYHLLCCLAGDGDATVSAIAKAALGVEMLGEDYSSSGGGDVSGGTQDSMAVTAEGGRTGGRVCVPFPVLMNTIIGSQSSSAEASRRPLFADFRVQAQTPTLRFLLHSLFSEESFYGDEDDIATGDAALRRFVGTILSTLGSYKDRSLNREETDLLDECAIALANCTSTLNDARSVVAAATQTESSKALYNYGYQDIAMQALSSNSSKTRRHLAQVMLNLYEDHSLWNTASNKGSSSPTLSDWAECSGLASAAKRCKEVLETLSETSQTSLVVGRVHGAAFLGSSCVRAFRLAAAAENREAESNQGATEEECWEHICATVSLLGKGLGHSDAAISNACSQGIVICFSYHDHNAPVLHHKLYDAVAVAFDAITSALKKFSGLDHCDATRISSLIRAAGLLLASSTSGAGFKKAGGQAVASESGSVDLGPARIQCTEALFGILGSPVYKKDDELSLVVGEALVEYADAMGAGKWSGAAESNEDGKEYDESLAFSLPPHEHILYTLFRREIKSSNPIKRNSCAATLLVSCSAFVPTLKEAFVLRS